MPTGAIRRSSAQRGSKDSGKRTARGAIAWRAANSPKPDPSYLLTPAEAADRLQLILAPPRAATRGARATGPRFAAVAAEWLERGERKRRLKYSTLKDYRYLINTHLLPTFGELELRAITRQHVERWHADYERTRTAGKVLMVLGAILRYAQRRELIAANPIDGVEGHPVRYSGDYDIYAREEIDDRDLARRASSSRRSGGYPTLQRPRRSSRAPSLTDPRSRLKTTVPCRPHPCASPCSLRVAALSSRRRGMGGLIRSARRCSRDRSRRTCDPCSRPGSSGS
jgi:hypothetical protein